MPGDDWQKFANLRLLFGYMFGQPGKKLLFMGGEWGQGREWNHDVSLDWHQADYPQHAGVLHWVADLNRVYRKEPALIEDDCNSAGFDWVDCHDAAASVLSWLRKSATTGEHMLVVCNFTPVPRGGYRVGCPSAAGGRNCSTATRPPTGAAARATAAAKTPRRNRGTATRIRWC